MSQYKGIVDINTGIEVNAGEITPTNIVVNDYQILETDGTIVIDANSNTVTVTMPLMCNSFVSRCKYTSIIKF